MSRVKEDTFIERCLRGEAMLDEIETYVERWHKSSTDGALHSFLGMTEEEYSLWLRDPDALAYIVAARHGHIPLIEVVNDNYQEEIRLAARSPGSAKIRRLKLWLEQNGKLV
jgi:hypothetical protein